MRHGRLAQLVAHPLDVREVTSSSLVSSTIKKVSFVYQTKETFLRDAFLAERDAHCVRDAASPVMHAFGACKNASTDCHAGVRYESGNTFWTL